MSSLAPQPSPSRTPLHARQTAVAAQLAGRLRRNPVTVLLQSGAPGDALDLAGALLPLLRRRAGDGPGPRRDRPQVVVPIPDRRAAGRREIVAVCSRWDAPAGPLAALQGALLAALPWADRDELESPEPLAERLLRWQRRHEARLFIVLDRCDALWREPPTPAAARLLEAIDTALAHPGLRCHWLIVLHDPARLATLSGGLAGLAAGAVRRSDTGGEFVDPGRDAAPPAGPAGLPPDERTLPSALGPPWPAAWRTDAAAGFVSPAPAAGGSAQTSALAPPLPARSTIPASVQPTPARRPPRAGRVLWVVALLLLAVVAWRAEALEFGVPAPRASHDPLVVVGPPAAGLVALHRAESPSSSRR